MLFVTQYEFKDDTSPQTMKEVLAVFAERGPAPGEIAHYVRYDGRGGTVLLESTPDIANQQYENNLHFQQWMTMETTPVLSIEEAMPTIMKVYG